VGCQAPAQALSLLNVSLYAGMCWQQGHFLHEVAG